ncbi:MAG: adenylate/guanylate cyclase domain-containing protein [Pseudomonadota bacterium]
MTPIRVAGVLAVVVFLIGIWRPTDVSETLAGLEGRLLDLRYALRGTRTPTRDVVILAIDDKALSNFGEFPLSRSSLAVAVSQIARAKPAAVAFDLLLTGDKPGDTDLAISLLSVSAAALAVSLSEQGEPPSLELLTQLRQSSYAIVAGSLPSGGLKVIAPASELSKQSSFGHVNVVRDAGGSLRRIPVAMAYGDDFSIPALSIAAAREALGVPRNDVILTASKTLQLGERKVELDRAGHAILNYLGPSGTIPTYSIADAETLPLAGKVVFIGGTAQGYGDRFATPFDRGLPGVEALATLTENIVSNTTLNRNATTWIIDLLLSAFAAVACTLAASRRTLAVAFAATSLVWVSSLLFIQFSFHQNLWLDATTTMIGLLLGSLAGLVTRQRMLTVRSQNLSRYGSPKIMEAVAVSSSPSFDGRLQPAAALFVDAAGFTPLSHALGPQGTMDLLKGFHAAIERAASKSNGSIEQFAGDGALVVFGLPEPRDQDAADALQCADRLFEEVAALRGRVSLPAETDLKIRVGIHYGEVMVAIVGEAHSHVTIAGTVVNAASRLEQLAKTENAELVVSGDLLTAARIEDRSSLRPLGKRNLRGLDEPIELWARERASSKT